MSVCGCVSSCVCLRFSDHTNLKNGTGLGLDDDMELPSKRSGSYYLALKFLTLLSPIANRNQHISICVLEMITICIFVVQM